MKIGLFIPCFVNAVYPSVGVASYKLLKALGLDVDYPLGQTCCGQPMANGGFEKDAAPLARRMEELFSGYDYVVGPSGSCVAFVKEHYPDILHREAHECLGSRIYEICEFIHDVVRPSELNVPHYSKLRDLLSLVRGAEVFEPSRVDECCGFGGMFSIEEPAVSACMGADKVRDHISTGAEYITGADSSCLMHMEGIIKRQKLPIKTIHIVEILASGL